MKMLHKCRAAHVLCVIWNAAFDGGIHLKIWPRERSVSGQIFSSYLCDHTQPVCTADVHGTRCLSTHYPILSVFSKVPVLARSSSTYLLINPCTAHVPVAYQPITQYYRYFARFLSWPAPLPHLCQRPAPICP